MAKLLEKALTDAIKERKRTLGAKQIISSMKNSKLVVISQSIPVETAKKSLLGKAKKRPDLLGKIIDFSKKEGIKSAYNLIQNRLSTPLQLGYSCVGEVIEVGEDEKNIMVGKYLCG